MNYYNEHDAFAAAWLRELIKVGAIPPGDVDERSITEVQPSDLRGYTQCHFFAGIGGWPLALQLAGWPADRPVWTGSCPCQPFSSAGKRKGAADERHLWPEMFRLIRECRPYTVFGEQVEGAIRHGWLDGISANLEGEVYAIGAVVLGAHSVRAPQIRQRLYWVADANRSRPKQGEQTAKTSRYWNPVEPNGDTDGLGYALQPGLEGHARHGRNGDQPGWLHADTSRPTSETSRADAWSSYNIIPCRDGKSRRVEPSIQPLAHGVPARVGQLRGYGNAIVPQVAAEFIGAYMDFELSNNI